MNKQYTKKHIRWILSAFILLFILIICACKTEDKTPHSKYKRQPIELETKVDKADATTDDIITYTVKVDMAPEVITDVPDFGAQIGNLKIVDMGAEPVKEIAGRRIIKKWYKLQTDASGSYTLKPVEISYKLKPDGELKQIQSSPIFIEIRSPDKPQNKQKDIIDIKDVEKLPVDYVFWALVAGGIVLIGLIVFGIIWYYRKRRKVEDKKEAIIPAYQTALAELEALKKQSYNSEQEIRKFYFNLSEIFRRYLEASYNFPATDWTTQEITRWLNKSRQLNFELKNETRNFLYSADLVKFADHIPTKENMQHDIGWVIDFVKAAKPQDTIEEVS